MSVGSAAPTANIRLATGGKITGKVVNRSGTAISGATLKLKVGLVGTTLVLITNSAVFMHLPWIAIGRYSVQVSKSGYTTQTKSATVNTGATSTLNFTMQWS